MALRSRGKADRPKTTDVPATLCILLYLGRPRKQRGNIKLKEDDMSTTKRDPPPRGFRRVFVKEFRHWRSGKMIRAADYGKEAFCFLARDH